MLKFKQWLTNIYDPKNQDAKIFAVNCSDETMEQAWQHHLKYLEDKIIGEPKPSKTYDVAAMKRMGIVGVYKLMSVSEFMRHQFLLIKIRWHDFLRASRR